MSQVVNVESLRSALAAGAQTLGVPLDERQTGALLRYLEQVQTWNRVYNLTAVRDAEGMLTQHVLDCLAIIPPLRSYQGQQPVQRLLDVGSGAGLPAVVLALMQPEMTVVSVDTVGKKAAFVQQVAGALKLANLYARHARVENLPPTEPFDLITARAFAALADLVTLTRSLLKPSGVWMAMKGHRPDDEISALPEDVEVFHVEQLSVPNLPAARCLIWMRHKD